MFAALRFAPAWKTVEGVINVHDLHVWSLGSQSRALACHVCIADIPPSESACILAKAQPCAQASTFTLATRPFSSSTWLRRAGWLRGAPVHHVFHDYQRARGMIPMRDGVKLHAVYPEAGGHCRAAAISDPAHSLRGATRTSRFVLWRPRPELARDGYIYVCGDIRGRYKSEGEFVMMRPLADHRDPRPWTRAPTPTTPWPGC
jgi:hypothetical protein